MPARSMSSRPRKRTWSERVQKLTRGKGARLVFDPVAGPTLAKLAAATKQHGIIFEYGALSTEPTPFPLFDVLGKLLTVRGYVLSEVTGDAKRLARAKQFVVDGLASGKLKPIISKVFHGLDQMAEAHRYMEGNTQFGKIVLTL